MAGDETKAQLCGEMRYPTAAERDMYRSNVHMAALAERCGALAGRSERATDDIALRKWAFEQAMRIHPSADEDVAIESADAILAWVTKRNTNG